MHTFDRFDDVFTSGSPITLEEGPGVLTVSPLASLDSTRGGFFVTDIKEHQVRAYDERGALRMYVGGTGMGDTTFQAPPMFAFRQHDDSVLTCDFRAMCSIVGTDGTLKRQFAVTELETVYGGVPINGTSKILIAGRGKAGDQLLHLWNATTGRVEQSFFKIPVRPDLEMTARFAGHVSVAVHAGRVAAVFALEPTVYVFDMVGNLERQIPIESKGFRPIQKPAPLETGDRETISAWANTLSRVSDVFWLSPDRLVVQYYDLVGLRLRWGVVGMTVTGQHLFEIMPSTKLMAVDPRTGALWFVAPPGESLNHWLPAHLIPNVAAR